MNQELIHSYRHAFKAARGRAAPAVVFKNGKYLIHDVDSPKPNETTLSENDLVAVRDYLLMELRELGPLV